ncbi:glycosyltransferase family 2 protein [Nitratidesulfovibrio liaohensis]|uniref:Glycosyltransferase family 2 protein n=1 Tax=Nitratidesulfovibrio liaohensis TaxID=2604158 RepID=A0ABY9R0P0_9BACT|nr:glycosyltransferase family 2 protein [Nitratidesulfovibrio liaohensis]WMW64319.1 glycosyltransferase family 2 protein [Nitratidesulfovibrio liaohensis]
MQLNAILCLWNEEDIIASTVRHAFAQGCDNVCFVDNGSTDDTVRVAQEAGARLVASFRTDVFDESKKVHYLNAAVEALNRASSHDVNWWLYIDADEFPDLGPGPGHGADTGPDAVMGTAMTLRDFVAGLPPSVGAVHGYMHDHLPTHRPYFASGYHPADFMPLCVNTGVEKVPLLRYVRGAPHVASPGGAHTFGPNGNTFDVAHGALTIHHFNHRDLDRTLERLGRLVSRNADGTSRIDWMDAYTRRVHGKDRSMYHERYATLRETYARNAGRALKTRDPGYAYGNLARWYDVHADKDIPSATRLENCISNGLHHLFCGHHDLALCRFNDALEQPCPDTTRLWLLIRMAECFAHSDRQASREIVAAIRPACDAEMAAYLHTLPI